MINNCIELAQVLSKMANDPEFITTYNKVTEMLYTALKDGQTVFICGNGGSHAAALSFASGFTGSNQEKKTAYPVMALGEATHTTCTGNGMGFDLIFSRQLDAFAKAGDLVIALSTTGMPNNIDEVIFLAKTSNIKSIVLLGNEGGRLKGQADIELIVPSNNSTRIQESHQLLLNSITEDALKYL